MEHWFFMEGSDVVAIVLSAILVYGVLIGLTRLSGLRSFSQMSGFDFSMTVAIGSVIANGIVSRDPPALQAILALGLIFAMRFVISYLRARFGWMSRIVDNQPVMLIENGQILHRNLVRTRMSEHDLRAKLRHANVFDLKAVRAAVLETGGDISVLRGEETLDDYMLKDVER
jgi:uncharacterized membrane protein YcaP (DUF421 family)